MLIKAPPGKPVTKSFPTPSPVDRIIVVRKDSRVPNFQLPASGTPLEGNTDFLFATAQPDPTLDGGEFYNLYYVNDRLNQEAYNFEYSFPYGTTDYPRITRSYVLMRSTWIEPAEGSGDPVFNPDDTPGGLLLIGHEQTRFDDQTMDALFVAVKRVYEKVPGPILSGHTQTGQGVVGTVSKQLVLVGSDPDTGANVLESEVSPENSFVGTKTTRTGALWSSSGSMVSDATLGATASVLVATADTPSVTSGLNVISSEASPDGPLRWANKTVSVEWPTLVGDEMATLSRYGHLIRFVSMVDRTETVDRVAPGTKTSGSFLTLESETKAETKDRSVRRVVTVPGFDALVSKSFDEFGNLETVTEEVVSPSTTIVFSGSEAQTLDSIDKYHSLRSKKTLTVDGEGNLVSAYVTEVEEVDPSIPNSRATIYYYLVDATTTIPDNTTTTIYTRRRYPKNPSIALEVKTVYSIPPWTVGSPLVESEDHSASFPGRPQPGLTTWFAWNEAVGIFYAKIPSFSRIVPHKVYTWFTTTRQDIAPTLIIEPFWELPGPWRDQLLNNGDTYSGVKNGVSFLYTLPTSTPSAATYETWVSGGTEIVVGGESRIWRAGIFKNVKITVPAQ